MLEKKRLSTNRFLASNMAALGVWQATIILFAATICENGEGQGWLWIQHQICYKELRINNSTMQHILRWTFKWKHIKVEQKKC